MDNQAQHHKPLLNQQTPKLKWEQSDEIIRRILAGEIGITPTETVAGILALPNKDKEINDIKNSPNDKPLACIISKAEECEDIWQESPRNYQSLAQFWPGPLTLIAGADGGRALRIPAIPELLNILQKTGPLACTSANFSNETAANTPEDVPDSLKKKVDFIIDEKPASGIGEASTILKYDQGEWLCLRQGALAENEWRNALK